MKLLLDQGVPRSVATLLCETGIDTVHTGEIGMARAEDAEILARAAKEDRTIVTLDADFHSLLALSHANKPTVIRVRIENLKAEQFAELLQNVLKQCVDDIHAGAMISVSTHQIRVRHLPVE